MPEERKKEKKKKKKRKQRRFLDIVSRNERVDFTLDFTL